MSTSKLFYSVVGLLLIVTAVPATSQAQFGIGASYEIRDEVPENGFGLRIEKGFLNKLPLLELAVRAHFSYFNENNTVEIANGDGILVAEQEITDWDAGLAAIGGIPIGLVKPYVGLGIGTNTVDVNFDEGLSDENTSKFFWNGLAGAEIQVLPNLHPFVEYRITQLSGEPIDQQNIPKPTDSNGRVIFGIMLKF